MEQQIKELKTAYRNCNFRYIDPDTDLCQRINKEKTFKQWYEEIFVPNFHLFPPINKNDPRWNTLSKEQKDAQLEDHRWYPFIESMNSESKITLLGWVRLLFDPLVQPEDVFIPNAKVNGKKPTPPGLPYLVRSKLNEGDRLLKQLLEIFGFGYKTSFFFTNAPPKSRTFAEDFKIEIERLKIPMLVSDQREMIEKLNPPDVDGHVKRAQYILEQMKVFIQSSGQWRQELSEWEVAFQLYKERVLQYEKTVKEFKLAHEKATLLKQRLLRQRQKVCIALVQVLTIYFQKEDDLRPETGYEKSCRLPLPPQQPLKKIRIERTGMIPRGLVNETAEQAALSKAWVDVNLKIRDKLLKGEDTEALYERKAELELQPREHHHEGPSIEELGKAVGVYDQIHKALDDDGEEQRVKIEKLNTDIQQTKINTWVKIQTHAQDKKIKDAAFSAHLVQLEKKLDEIVLFTDSIIREWPEDGAYFAEQMKQVIQDRAIEVIRESRAWYDKSLGDLSEFVKKCQIEQTNSTMNTNWINMMNYYRQYYVLGSDKIHKVADVQMFDTKYQNAYKVWLKYHEHVQKITQLIPTIDAALTADLGKYHMIDIRAFQAMKWKEYKKVLGQFDKYYKVLNEVLDIHQDASEDVKARNETVQTKMVEIRNVLGDLGLRIYRQYGVYLELIIAVQNRLHTYSTYLSQKGSNVEEERKFREDLNKIFEDVLTPIYGLRRDPELRVTNEEDRVYVDTIIRLRTCFTVDEIKKATPVELDDEVSWIYTLRRWLIDLSRLTLGKYNGNVEGVKNWKTYITDSKNKLMSNTEAWRKVQEKEDVHLKESTWNIMYTYKLIAIMFGNVEASFNQEIEDEFLDLSTRITNIRADKKLLFNALFTFMTHALRRSYQLLAYTNYLLDTRTEWKEVYNVSAVQPFTPDEKILIVEGEWNKPFLSSLRQMKAYEKEIFTLFEHFVKDNDLMARLHPLITGVTMEFDTYKGLIGQLSTLRNQQAIKLDIPLYTIPEPDEIYPLPVHNARHGGFVPFFKHIPARVYTVYPVREERLKSILWDRAKFPSFRDFMNYYYDLYYHVLHGVDTPPGDANEFVNDSKFIYFTQCLIEKNVGDKAGLRELLQTWETEMFNNVQEVNDVRDEPSYQVFKYEYIMVYNRFVALLERYNSNKQEPITMIAFMELLDLRFITSGDALPPVKLSELYYNAVVVDSGLDKMDTTQLTQAIG